MEIKPQDIKKLIEDEGDFGHEMLVGETFRKANPEIDNFHPTIKGEIHHGGTYTDPNLKKPRQFDYQFELLHSGAQAVTPAPDQSIRFAVECKNLHESSPLLVCCIPRTRAEAFHNFIASRFDARMGNTWNQVFKADSDHKEGLYRTGQYVGKSLVRLKVEEKAGKLPAQVLKVDTQADLYERWAQAIQSAASIAEPASREAFERQRHEFFTMLLPVVVVPDGRLWTIAYNHETGQHEEPTKVDQCEYFVGRTVDQPNLEKPWFVITHVHFVTVKGFSELLDKYLQRGRAWENWEKLFAFGGEMKF